MRQREMALKVLEARRGRWTPVQATVAGAILTLIGAVAGHAFSAWSAQTVESKRQLGTLETEKLKVSGTLDLERHKQDAQRELERNKFETSLILEAIKAPSRAEAIRNLKFFVAAGFVSDEKKRIVNLRDDELPYLGSPSPASSGRALRAAGVLAIELENGKNISCTGVAVSPKHVVTAGYCIRPFMDPQARSVKFNFGGQQYSLSSVRHSMDANVALLRVDEGGLLPAFMNVSSLRDPIAGEAIYLAASTDAQKIPVLQVCSVATVDLDKRTLRHNCPGGRGAAGAIIVGVNDDVLLGVHYARSDGDRAGVAVLLPADLMALLESAR
jgi:hypothetical protein